MDQYPHLIGDISGVACLDRGADMLLRRFLVWCQ